VTDTDPVFGPCVWEKLMMMGISGIIFICNARLAVVLSLNWFMLIEFYIYGKES